MNQIADDAAIEARLTRATRTVDPFLIRHTIKGVITEGAHKDGAVDVLIEDGQCMSVKVNGKEVMCRKIRYVAEAGEPPTFDIEVYATNENGKAFVQR